MAEEREVRKRKRRDTESEINGNKIEEHNLDNKNMYVDLSYKSSSSSSLKPSSLSEESQESVQLSEYGSKHENEESLLGEQTPHGKKSQRKNLRVFLYKEHEVTPIHMREIPLPAMSWVDRTELSLLMCFKEDVLDKDRDPNMFKKHPNLTSRMRSILFDWLMEVCDVYKLRRVTYYLAIDYVDRYLSRVEELPKNQLQLLGITCLFIAAKVEEVYPPKLSELAYVTDGACTDQEMLLKEMAILQVLNWDVNPMTVSGWLNLYMQILYNTKNVRESSFDRTDRNDDFIFPQFSAFAFVRASQLVDFCSLDEGMLNFQYSIIAAAAIYYIFNRERALFVSGFEWKQIKDCVLWMTPFYTVVNKLQLFSAYEGPKERCRGSSGLKRANPNILVNEAHSVQTHMISLKMLENVYKMTHECTESCESAEESSEPKESNSIETHSLSVESGEEESLVDVDIIVDVKKQLDCDPYSEEINTNNNLLVTNEDVAHLNVFNSS